MNFDLVPGETFSAQVNALLYCDFETFKQSVYRADWMPVIARLAPETRRALADEIKRQYPYLPEKNGNCNPRIVAQTILNVIGLVESL